MKRIPHLVRFAGLPPFVAVPPEQESPPCSGNTGTANRCLPGLLSHLPDRIDLLLLDGAKALYPLVLALLETRPRPGALIVADNAGYSPEYLAQGCSPDAGCLSIPFAEDVALPMRIG